MAQNGAGPQEAAQVVTQRALQLLVPDKTPRPWVLGPGYHPKRWSLFHCTVGWGLKRTLPAS